MQNVSPGLDDKSRIWLNLIRRNFPMNRRNFGCLGEIFDVASTFHPIISADADHPPVYISYKTSPGPKYDPILVTLSRLYICYYLTILKFKKNTTSYHHNTLIPKYIIWEISYWVPSIHNSTEYSTKFLKTHPSIASESTLTPATQKWYRQHVMNVHWHDW